MKRFLSLFLVLIVIISVTSLSVFGTESVCETSCEESTDDVEEESGSTLPLIICIVGAVAVVGLFSSTSEINRKKI